MKWALLLHSRNTNILIINVINTINNHDHHFIISNDNLLINDLLHNDIQVQFDDDTINMITIMNNNLEVTTALTNCGNPVTGKPLHLHKQFMAIYKSFIWITQVLFDVIIILYWNINIIASMHKSSIYTFS